MCFHSSCNNGNWTSVDQWPALSFQVIKLTQSSVYGVYKAARPCDPWCKPCCKVIYTSKVIWGLSDGETTSLMLPDAFSTSTQLLISQAKCTINRLLVSLLYLITVLHSGNVRRRNVRFRKSHFCTGKILVLEWEEAKSNGSSSKTEVGVILMATWKVLRVWNDWNSLYYHFGQVEESLDNCVPQGGAVCIRKFAYCIYDWLKGSEITITVWNWLCGFIKYEVTCDSLAKSENEKHLVKNIFEDITYCWLFTHFHRMANTKM